MKRIIILFFCIGLAGCSCFTGNRSLKQQAAQLKISLSDKEEQIRQLQEALAQKEALVSEKESKIKELRRKLASLGVF